MPAWAKAPSSALPHPDFGEGVTAVVVRGAGVDRSLLPISSAPSPGGSPNTSSPKRVIFVDELPRNTMGKVQKNVLRETYRDLYVPQKAG